MLIPLLALADRIGLLSAPPEALGKLADRLDQLAERCGPAIATYTNPAKTLAAELADSLPLIWTEGTVAGAVGRHFATELAGLAGRPALAAELPEALTTHRTLLAGALAAGADPDDFFRDRVEQPAAMHARVVLLREQEPGRAVRHPRRPGARRGARHRRQRTGTGRRQRPGEGRGTTRHRGFRRRLPGARRHRVIIDGRSAPADRPHRLRSHVRP